MFRQHFAPEEYTECLASMMYKLYGWKCSEKKDWDSCWGAGMIYDWAANSGEEKRHILEMGKSSELFVSF